MSELVESSDPAAWVAHDVIEAVQWALDKDMPAREMAREIVVGLALAAVPLSTPLRGLRDAMEAAYDNGPDPFREAGGRHRRRMKEAS